MVNEGDPQHTEQHKQLEDSTFQQANDDKVT